MKAVSPIDVEEAVIARIAEVAATIRQQPGIFLEYMSISSLSLPAAYRVRWPYVWT